MFREYIFLAVGCAVVGLVRNCANEEEDKFKRIDYCHSKERIIYRAESQEANDDYHERQIYYRW